MTSSTQSASQLLQLSVLATGDGRGSVASTPGGINCGSTCSASFSPGTQVVLAATAAHNSSFAGWGGDCNGSGACRLTLSGNSSGFFRHIHEGGAAHVDDVFRNWRGCRHQQSFGNQLRNATCSARFHPEPESC